MSKVQWWAAQRVRLKLPEDLPRTLVADALSAERKAERNAAMRVVLTIFSKARAASQPPNRTEP